MAFPGIISRLHPSPAPQDLALQLQQGQHYRAEAFLLPESMMGLASEISSALPERISLYLNQEQAGLTLRGHDGALHADGTLKLHNGQHIELAKAPGQGKLVPESGLREMGIWLEAGHNHFICPAALQPVARAILNIWPLDPYLAKHFLLSFTPLLESATEQDLLAVLTARLGSAIPQPDWVEAYMKLEKRLHRTYLDH
jgi:hypothetical protein